MPSPVTMVLGGVAVVGIGWLAYSHWRASQPAESSRCGGLGTLAGELAGLAGSDPASASSIAERVCNNVDVVTKVGEGIVNGVYRALGGRTLAEKLATNERLNGPVVDSIDPAMPWAGHPSLVAASKGPLGGKGKPIGPLRHQNGCVPYTGADGFEKCAPGSFGLKPGRFGENVGKAAIAPNSNDPFSFKHPAGLPFPQSVAAGATAYWVNGKPFVCAAGTSMARDNRSGAATPACWPDRPPPTGPRSAPDDTFVETPRHGGGTTRDHRS